MGEALTELTYKTENTKVNVKDYLLQENIDICMIFKYVDYFNIILFVWKRMNCHVIDSMFSFWQKFSDFDYSAFTWSTLGKNVYLNLIIALQ